MPLETVESTAGLLSVGRLSVGWWSGRLRGLFLLFGELSPAFLFLLLLLRQVSLTPCECIVGLGHALLARLAPPELRRTTMHRRRYPLVLVPEADATFRQVVG